MNRALVLSALCAGLGGVGCSSSGGTSGGAAGSGGSEAVMRLGGKSEAELCQYYAEHYPVADATPVTGSDLSCAPGELSSDGVKEYRQRIDFYRQWLGLSPTGEPDPALSAKAQECAMMMGAAQKLSHEPDPNWPCYTQDGASAALQSNIGLDASPAKAVDAYVFDWGNESNPGHRRWLFYPEFRGLGYGFFDGGPGGQYGEMTGSCVIVFDGPMHPDENRTDQPVVYPPAGAFPAALASFVAVNLYKVTWTISWQGASFAGATLTLTDRATQQPIPLDQPLQEYPPDFGADAAGFIPSPAPQIGDGWSVRVDGIVLDGVPQLPLEYDVDFVDCGATPPFP